ncbi:hypothetical protein BDZ89DRAFT_1145730 [Hymenopellis radicata]|nr:hypothetical protein BDZ89DRAFT_1145730 [Hymenopellis radicata]
MGIKGDGILVESIIPLSHSSLLYYSYSALHVHTLPQTYTSFLPQVLSVSPPPFSLPRSRRVQNVTGLLITVFLGLHCSDFLCALSSAAWRTLRQLSYLDIALGYDTLGRLESLCSYTMCTVRATAWSPTRLVQATFPANPVLGLLRLGLALTRLGFRPYMTPGL